MDNKWNLISSKKSVALSDVSSKKESLTPINEETPDRTVMDSFFERRKRKHNEMTASSATEYNPTLTALNMNKSFTNLQLDENLSKSALDPTMRRSKLVRDTISIKADETSKASRSESVKNMSIKTLEEFLFVDERFIENDRNITLSSINPGKNSS